MIGTRHANSAEMPQSQTEGYKRRDHERATPVVAMLMSIPYYIYCVKLPISFSYGLPDKALMKYTKSMVS